VPEAVLLALSLAGIVVEQGKRRRLPEDESASAARRCHPASARS